MAEDATVEVATAEVATAEDATTELSRKGLMRRRTPGGATIYSRYHGPHVQRSFSTGRTISEISAKKYFSVGRDFSAATYFLTETVNNIGRLNRTDCAPAYSLYHKSVPKPHNASC